MKKNVYEFLMCMLAVMSVTFVIIDLNNGMTNTMIMADSIIYVIFVFDYFGRLLLSKNKKQFIKESIFDLIAIIPFSSAFRIFRVFKFSKLIQLTKLTKLAKLTKLVALSGRLLSKIRIFLNTNGFKYILTLSVVLIFVGGTLFSFSEDIALPDGIWWAFVTSTTVGYGDISPNTIFGRIIACILMVCGIGLIGSLTSTITTFFINSSNTDSEPCNDRIDMVIKLYEELNDCEKNIFKKRIK